MTAEANSANLKNILRALPVVFLLLSGCTNTEEHLRKIMKEQSELIDPTSAQFRKIAWNQIFTAWCGEINSKDKAGDDSGWTPFIITIREGKQPYVAIISKELFLEDRIMYDATLEIHQLYCGDAKPARAYFPLWSDR